ncbi:MAG TPA: cytochrome C oxidase subunit IV family protein [Gemmatimonadaceae bacterium]|jgi:cytochrome c oxidase subunit 4|nr:cytochrome C oxidase subunit IV family protein [Gemmatimonadaceae bacterium]
MSDSLKYVVVWIALVVLATGTLLLSRLDLGAGNFVIAMAIATAKAALVVAVFMHLARGKGLHRLALAVAVAFVLLLLGGVLADVGTRDAASPYVSSPK